MTTTDRRKQRRPDVPVTDPLADLRAEPMAMTTPTYEGAQALATAMLDVPPDVFDQAWHDAAVLATVQAWHDDLTASRYAHKGGSCGCFYLARLCLTTTVGVALPDAAEGEGERDG